MADEEILLHPEILAELERYRALERRVRVSRQQRQEFSELARQVVPGSTIPLSTPLRDGSPAAELDATLSALRQQIETIHQIEAQRNKSLEDLRRPVQKGRPSQTPEPSIPPVNVKIALYFLGGVVLFILSLVILHAVSH